MSDERYFTVTASFDPSVFALTSMPWTPVAGAGQDPSDMRTRRLVTPRVGRFRPDTLGRKAKSTSSLVQVWTDGPVNAGDRYFVLGSDDAAESTPTSVQRGAPANLTTSPLDAVILELGPTDHLAIETEVLTTCYIRVLDLDEDQMARYLNKRAVSSPCCTPSTAKITVNNAVDDTVIVIPVLAEDYVLVEVAADARTFIELPPRDSVPAAQEIVFARADGSEGLVLIAPTAPDLLNLSSLSLAMPLRGAISVRAGAALTPPPGGYWSGLQSIQPRAASLGVGNFTFNYGWPGLRIFTVLDPVDPQTVTLPPYAGANVPVGCHLRLCNPTTVDKTLRAAAGELVNGKTQEALAIIVPGRTNVDAVFNGLVWTLI